MRSYFTLLLYLLLLAPAYSQKNTSGVKEYAAPLKGPLLVTGTFGELRSDHYHAGLDFRGATGTPVYAVNDGFVSRLVVSGGGYGQAIYVDHPDGYRSVYGHLEALSPELTDTLRKRQFGEERFAQDLRFDSLAYPIARGQRIGQVGNRGHSFGSHLHFEMREIADDVPVNPLRFGFSVPDHRQPQIRSLRVYELDGAGRELAATTYKTKALGDTIFVRTPHVGIAVKAYDRQDAMPNWNGIYSAELFVDSVRRSGILHERIPHEQTQYLNAQTDYREWRENTSWFHRLWRLGSGNKALLPTGGAFNDGPALRLPLGRPAAGYVEVKDFAGNVTRQGFILKYRAGTDAPAGDLPHQYFLPAGEESLIERPGFSLHFPETALYEDLYLQYGRLSDDSADRVSATYHVHEARVPLHGRATIRVKPGRPVADSLMAHVYLGQCDDDGRPGSRGGRWTENGWVEARIGGFGDYALFLDTVPPTVEVHVFPTNLSRSGKFSVEIKDDVSGGRLGYRGTIDGKWVLLEYDAKKDRLNGDLRVNGIGRGKHIFELTVTDARGNTTGWRRNFVF